MGSAMCHILPTPPRATIAMPNQRVCLMVALRPALHGGVSGKAVDWSVS